MSPHMLSLHPCIFALGRAAVLLSCCSYKVGIATCEGSRQPELALGLLASLEKSAWDIWQDRMACEHLPDMLHIVQHCALGSPVASVRLAHRSRTPGMLAVAKSGRARWGMWGGAATSQTTFLYTVWSEAHPPTPHVGAECSSPLLIPDSMRLALSRCWSRELKGPSPSPTPYAGE